MTYVIKRLGIGIALVSLFLFFSVSISHADFSGSWSGQAIIDGKDHGTLTVDIVQNGSELTGEYETSTGLKGNFSGTGESDQFSFAVEKPPSCSATISGTGSLAGEILTWQIDLSECADIPLIHGAVTKNHIQTNRWMNVVQTKKVYENITEGEIYASLANPDGKTPQSVDLITPMGTRYPMVWNSDSDQWEVFQSSGLASHLYLHFPDGIYGYELSFEDNTKGVVFVVLMGDYPDEFPVITSPANGGYSDPSQVLNVEWQKASSSVTGIYYTTQDGDSVIMDGSLSVDSTSVAIPAESYSTENMAKFYLSFARQTPGTHASKVNATEIAYFSSENWFGKPEMILGKYHHPRARLAECSWQRAWEEISRRFTWWERGIQFLWSP